MIDLENISGLPIELDNEIIKPKEGFPLAEPDFRKLEDFLFVLKSDSPLTGPEIAYSMFRKTAKNEEAHIFEDKKLEYDLTVLSAGPVGSEKMKTIGHYHSKKEGTEVYYPEVYEVLYGKAHYILQKLKGESEADLEDVKIIEAVAGEKIVVPPGYGHITINPTDDTLVESNIQSSINVSDYTPYLNLHGAAFYELESGEFLKNEKYYYDKTPKIIKAKDINDVFGIQNGVPLYKDYINNPEKYNFVINPDKYLDKFDQLF